MRVHFGVLAGVVVSLCLVSAAEAATFKPCDVGAKGRTCGLLTVPLDRSGAVPGTVTLRVERSRARKAARPPLFVVAGGPGDSTTSTYRSDLTRTILGTETRSRDVVVMDLRGTGRSNVLRCEALERARRDTRGDAAAACAEQLGTRRAFYTPRDSAQDIEAVRVALGVPRIAFLGESYATRTVLEYARRYPANVERMVLSSPVAPAGLDPLERSSFAALPRVLRRLCPRGACRMSTRNLVADTRRLARRLGQTPLRGALVDGSGRRRIVTAGPEDLYDLASVDSVSFGVSVEAFPGLVRNALRGDAAPLLRSLVRARDDDLPTYSPRASSPAAAAASVCEDSTFPWSRTAPPTDRDRHARDFISGLPASTFAPFGAAAALRSDTLELCRRWPAASPPPEPSASLPAIPTLIVANEQQTRGPVEDAVAVAQLIPGAQLLRDWSGITGVPGLLVDECSRRAARRFLAGGHPDACPRRRGYLSVSKPPPLTLSELPRVGAPGRAGRTFAAVQLTVADGVESAMFEVFERFTEAQRRLREGRAVDNVLAGTMRAGGLRHGRVIFGFKSNRLQFERVSYVPGVFLSGSVSNFFKGSSRKFRGVLRVSGGRAARGRLLVRGDRLRGRLGGRRVRGRLNAPYAAFYDNGEGAFFMSPASAAALRPYRELAVASR